MDTLKTNLDTATNFFGQRLRAAIERRGYTADGFAKVMGISRATLYNWFERAEAPPSKKYQTELVRILREPEAYLLRGSTEQSKTGHLKEGGPATGSPARSPVEYGTVASRLRASDARVPERSDCEQLFQNILDAAEASGDPSAFPVIMHRLKKQFPLDEFESSPE